MARVASRKAGSWARMVEASSSAIPFCCVRWRARTRKNVATHVSGSSRLSSCGKGDGGSQRLVQGRSGADPLHTP